MAVNNRVLICGTGAYARALTYFMLNGGYDVTVYAGNFEANTDFKRWCKTAPVAKLKLRTDQFQFNVNLSELKGVKCLILAVPSHCVRTWVANIMAQLIAQPIWILVSKGLYDGASTTNCWVDYVNQVVPGEHCQGVAAVYGPSVANDMLTGCVTTFLVAAPDPTIRTTVKQLFEHNFCHVQVTSSVAGAELAFAMKNVLAIAGGIWTAIPNLTTSERCALSGLAFRELVRLFRLWKLDLNLLLEPAFIGDFILALTSVTSRNFYLGSCLVNKQLPPPVTVEGKTSLAIVYRRLVQQQQHTKFPLISQLYRVLFQHQSPTTRWWKDVF